MPRISRMKGRGVAFAGWLREQAIPVDFLVNNAGLGDHGAFETSEWNRVRAMLDDERHRAHAPHAFAAALPARFRPVGRF